jgi:type IV secretion system protein TrbL
MKIIFSVLLLLATGGAYAAAPPIDVTSIVGTLQASMLPAVDKLSAYAIRVLGVLAALQFFMTNYSLIMSEADISKIITKAAGSVAWIAVCLYLISNGPAFISGVGDDFFTILGVSFPTPGSIIGSTLATSAGFGILAFAVGQLNSTGGQMLMYVSFAVLAVGMFFAFKILMLHLEIALVAVLAPLSFAYLGLNALKDQGIAPFKALISLGYRILLLSLFMSAFKDVSKATELAMSSTDAKSIFMNGFGDSILMILSPIAAYICLVYFVFKSDSIAATLASGSTNMGTGDVASAAAAGAAAGAAITSAGASLAATSPVQSMADFMKSIGGGGSIANASGSGTGGLPMAPSAVSPPSASLSPSAPSQSDQSPGATPSAPAASADIVSGGNIGPSLDNVNPPIPRAPSGGGAGIGGAAPTTEQKLDQLLASQQGAGKKTLMDHVGNANQHMSQEKAATHVSINTHAQD